MRPRLLFCLLPWLGLTIFSGCSVIPEPQPDPTRHYVLNVQDPVVGILRERTNGLRVGLRDVTLPAYLDQGSLVVRRGESEIDYLDFSRWAEPLAAGIARLLTAQLLTSPAVASVVADPFPFDQERDCDVAVTIIRCEGVIDGSTPLVRFAAMVEISTADDEPRVLHRRIFVAPDQPWDGTDCAALVQAFNMAVWGLGDGIIGALPAN